MLYKNLRAEMARNSLTRIDIAKALGVRLATVSDKMNGKSRFFFDEATQIRDCFFPHCDLEYLFEKDDEKSA